jgi:transcriptional regulator with XRE-family HTH domain
LKVARIRAGATQRDVARHMGVSAARVSVIERGAVEEETAKQYTDALDRIADEQVAEHQTVERITVLPMPQGFDAAREYKAAKNTARLMTRKYPWVKLVELVIHAHNPAAVLGYLDGYNATGVSVRFVTPDGAVINRRIG